MFYYFGRKGRAAHSYPAPDYPLVIEPFAGSMAYTLHHRPPSAIGIEIDRQTVDLWHRLCGMTVDEIRDFPLPVVGERTTDRWIIQGSCSNKGATLRWRTVTPFMVTHFQQQRERITLRHHDYAHTSVVYALGDYRQAPDIEATWFIDPPYQKVTSGYQQGADTLDFDELGEWVMTRRGQVITCEDGAADWLPFQPHRTWRGMHTKSGAAPIREHVFTRRTHARCAVCSVTFPASRADARYCSGRCRMRALRAQTAGGASAPPATARQPIRARYSSRANSAATVRV